MHGIRVNQSPNYFFNLIKKSPASVVHQKQQRSWKMNLIDTRPEYPPEWDDQINLAEFIGNLDPKNENENALLTKLRVLIVKHKDEFKPIIEACEDYWVNAAEKQATDEFESGELFDDGEP